MRVPSYFVLKLSFLFLIRIPAWSIESYAPIVSDPLTESWRWQKYDELTGKIVECISEAPNGTIWFGLNNGVASFDGYNWQFYSNAHGLDDGHVTAICATRNGIIYAGTRSAIYKFENNRWSRFFPAKGKINFKIFKIIECTDGSIWAAMVDGVLCIHQKQSVFYTAQFRERNLHPLAGMVNQMFELPLTRYDNFFTVFDVYQDLDGHLWFLGWFGSYLKGMGRIIRFNYLAQRPQDPKVWKIFSDIDGLEIGYNSKMCQTSDKKLWIISRRPDKGVIQFNGDEWRLISLNSIGGSDKNVAIMETSDKTCWIGAPGRLHLYRNNQWKIYQYPEVSIPVSSYELLESRNGGVLLAGRNGDVYYLDYGLDRWQTLKGIHYQCDSPSGIQWFISKKNRVISKEKNEWKAYSPRDGLIDTPVLVTASTTGYVWAAGSHRGNAAVAYLKGRKWIRKVYPDVSWGLDYRSGAQTNQGHVIFGAGADPLADRGYRGGAISVAVDRTGRIRTKYYYSPDIPPTVVGIHQTKNGDIWFGGDGISYQDKNGFHKMFTGDSLRIDRIQDLEGSGNDHVWIAIDEGGLLAYIGNKWYQYNHDNGLSSNIVSSILNAKDETIWVGTDKGISHFDGTQWFTHALPAVITLNRESGAILQSGDGALWINRTSREWYRRGFSSSYATGKNASVFETIKYHISTDAPETEIELKQRRVSNPGNIVVKWKGRDNWHSVEGSPLEYSYRLDKKTWSPYSIANSHTFFNLGGGNHSLEVRARDGDFNVDPTPAKVSFYVIPPVYQQHWFIILCAGFLAVIVILEIRVIRRDIHLRRQARYREVIEDQSEFICRFLSSGQLSFVNLAFCRLTGYSREDLLQESYFSFVPEEDIPHLTQKLTELSSENPTLSLERRVIIQGDNIEWQQWIYRVVYDKRGQVFEYQGVGRDITERVRTEDELRNLTEKLRNLSSHLHLAREKESNRISRKIHDELGQVLTALKFDLFWLSQRIDEVESEKINKIKNMIEVLNSTTVSVQKLSQELRPKLLDDLGLKAAIEWQLREFENRTSIKTNLKAIDEAPFDLDRTIAIYRIFQEALTNIARHSKATEVWVEFNYGPAEWSMSIIDNGIGIEEEQINNYKSLGVIGMQERAYFLDGELEISNNEKQGASVIIKISLDHGLDNEKTI